MPKLLITVFCCLFLVSLARAQAPVSKTHTPPLQATTKTEGDFNVSSRYTVEIDGVSVAGVHAITDLNALHQQAVAVQSPRDSRRPGTLTITKDWSNTSEWFQWRKSVLDGRTERKSVSIIFHNDAGAEVGRMNFFNCWPTKYTEPTMEAKNSGHATETIELSYERMEWVGK